MSQSHISPKPDTTKNQFIATQRLELKLVNSVYTNLVVEEVRDNVVNQYGGFETGVLFDGVANSIGDYSLAESLEDYSLLICCIHLS